MFRLLAEIHENKDNFGRETSEMECCYDFLINSEPLLPEKLTLTKLFQLYIYKNCPGNTKPNLNTLRNDINKINSDSNNFLQILALETVFNVDICKYFGCYVTNTAEMPQEKLLQFGILKKIDNKLHFTHRAFAEYFAAECISNELSNYQNEPFFTFFCEDILTSGRYKVIRAFLDSFILSDSKSLPKQTLILIANTVKPTDYNLQLYTSASEGLLELLKFLLNCCQAATITIDVKNIRVGQNHALFDYFSTLFCEDILTSDRYKVVRAFLDTFLLTDSNCLPKESLILIADTLEPDYNIHLYKSASEGLLELLKFLFKCFQAANITIDMKSIRVGLNHALHPAASNGHFEVVKYLLENGVPVDVRNEKDLTVLHLAAKTGNLAMVKFLVELGVEVDCKDAKGRTALHEASTKGSFEMVRYLLENGAYVNSRDKDGYTALHITTRMGDIDRIKYLVDKGADIHSRGDRTGTVISNAVLSGNLDVIKYLVEKGADVTVKTKSGESIVHVLPDWNENTCMENVIEMWKFLLGKGVDVDSILHKAVKGRYKVEYIRFLIEQGADVNKDYLLNAAMYKNDVERLKYLMDNGALFNVNHNQEEKLHDAIRDCRIEVVKHLAERGVSLNITNEGGYPFLDVAVRRDNLEMIKLLVQNSVKIYRPEVLKDALKRCNFETVKFLVDSGADAKIDFGEVESKDLESVKFLIAKGAKFTKFHDVENNFELLKYLLDNSIEVNKTNIFSNAAKKGNLKIVKFLLEKGVDINAKNEREDTALHLAIERNHISVIKCLLESGADIEIKNRAGYTPLYIATSKGCLEAAKILLDIGANIESLATSYGQSALRDAMQGGYVETIKYMIEHGAPINVEHEYKETPLSQALNFELLDVAELLAQKDPKYQCKLEEMVQRIVNSDGTESTEHKHILNAIFRRVSTVKYLIEKGVDFTPRVIDKYKFFLSAVAEGDFKLVSYLIKKGCDINVKDYEEYTALHKMTGLNMAKLLIENGANVNARTRRGKSVLHKAIEESNLDMCKLLIENGADIHVRDKAGRTLLHMGTYNFYAISIDKIKYLIEKGTKLTLTKNGRSVLHDTVDLDLMKYFLTLGQDVNCRGRKGNTPLNEAIARGDFDVVRLLVENGTKVNKGTSSKPGVLLNAIKCHRLDDWNCSLDMVKYLVSKGANVNSKDKNGNTLLCHAISEENLEVVKFLIDSGAEVNVKDKNGSSPLLKACKTNNFSLMNCLIDNGATCDAATAAGRAALHEAVSYSSYAVVKFLLENGGDVNARDKEGRTLLHESMAGPHFPNFAKYFSVHKLLLEKGADVNAKTRKGLTALHEGVLRVCCETTFDKVKLLIEDGADVNAKDNQGRTPIFTIVVDDNMLGAIRYQKKLFEILVNSGANVDEKADNGRTAIQEAAILGRLEMVRHLVELGADINGASLDECVLIGLRRGEGWKWWSFLRRKMKTFMLNVTQPWVKTGKGNMIK